MSVLTEAWAPGSLEPRVLRTEGLALVGSLVEKVLGSLEPPVMSSVLLAGELSG